uniref:TM2 domain containing 1 n=1 Tax=Capra hircus TaxID=9925 RepID=A0A8C2N5C2_CAPHI
MAAACPCRPIAPETAAARLMGVLWFVSVTTGPWGAAAGGAEETLKCEDLKMGQYICKDPKINDATQEPVNCTNYTAYVQCFPAPNIICKDFGGNETHFTGSEVGFFKPISCRNVNGYSYKVAVALSLFLGWLGADRFYLGYPALEISAFYLDLYPCYFGNRNYFFQEKDLDLLDFNRELSIYKTSDFYFFKYHFMDSF